MKIVVLFLMSAFLLAGCWSTKKLPSEDLEVLERYKNEIAILKDPRIRPNSRKKYEAAKYLAEHVDFSFTRNVRTLDQIFLAQDAHVDKPGQRAHTILFYYPYEDHSVRFTFHRNGNVVTGSTVLIK